MPQPWLTSIALVRVDPSSGAALLDAIVADARSNAFRLTLLRAYKPGAARATLRGAQRAFTWHARAGISVERAMALLDLKEKKHWADFASKECISLDAAGCIDAKETQVPPEQSPPRVCHRRRIYAASKGCKASGYRRK